jgi:hypothetical protein
MKPFIRVKKVRGNEYLYEITPYYDSVTGKVRQKSRYLGKKDESGAAIPPVSRKQTSRVLACGDYLPFLGVARDLGFETMLQSVIPPRDTSVVMALAVNLASRPGTLSGVREWYNWTAVSLAYPDADMRPGRILQVVQSLADFRILDSFTTHGIEYDAYTRPAGLVAGIVPEETAPPLRDYSPPGVQPSTEYCLILCNPGEGIVTGLRRLPDSAPARLKACIHTNSLIEEYTPIVFPRGCITAGHLGLLAPTDFPFVLPVPPLRVFGSDDAKVILKAVLADYNYHTMEDEAVYIKAAPVSIGSRVIPGFIVLNASSERIARIRHHHEIMRIEEDLHGITVLPEVNPDDIIRDIAGDLAPFVTWVPDGTGGHAKIDRERLTYAIMEAGMIMVLHRGGMLREDCLNLLSARRTFNDILSERLRLLYRMIQGQPAERIPNGILILAVLAAALRWRLEKLLPRVKGKYGTSVDTLMQSLCNVTITAGPGRKRKPGGAIEWQRALLTTLDCMPERVIPGCSPLPGTTAEDRVAEPDKDTGS